MKDIYELENNIFEDMKNVVKNHSIYNPKVVKGALIEQYPSVVFSSNTNKSSYLSQDEYRLDRCRKIAIEVLIFAKTENGVDSYIICDEISRYVDDVIGVYYGLNGGVSQKIRNINTSQVSEYVLHYDCEWVLNNNKIY